MNRAEQNLAAQMTLFYEQDRTELCCTNDVVYEQTEQSMAAQIT